MSISHCICYLYRQQAVSVSAPRTEPGGTTTPPDTHVLSIHTLNTTCYLLIKPWNEVAQTTRRLYVSVIVISDLCDLFDLNIIYFTLNLLYSLKIKSMCINIIP